MKALSVAAAVFLAATAALADDSEVVRRLDKELTVATWTGDEMWFAENLSDDYVLITPNGAVKSKADVIRELSTAGVKMDPFDTSDVQLRLYGDTAIVTGRIRQRFTLGQSRYANDVRYTDVYVKKKGRWLLVSAHASTVTLKR